MNHFWHCKDRAVFSFPQVFPPLFVRDITTQCPNGDNLAEPLLFCRFVSFSNRSKHPDALDNALWRGRWRICEGDWLSENRNSASAFVDVQYSTRNGASTFADVLFHAENGAPTFADVLFHAENGAPTFVDVLFHAENGAPTFADVLFHAENGASTFVDVLFHTENGAPTFADAPFRFEIVDSFRSFLLFWC